MSDDTIVIVNALRTPIGSFCGKFSTVKAVDLGAVVIKELIQRTNIEPSEISEVIMGQILLTGTGQNPARQAALKAQIPNSVPAFTVNQLCGSGLKSVVLGYQSILCGDASVVISGGQESMSLTPHYIYMRNPMKTGDGVLTDSLISDGLTDAFYSIHMGVTAENIAKEYNISRKEQDLFSVKSQSKVEQAQKLNYFEKEIVPVQIQTRKELITVSSDEFPKPGTTVEALEKLRPAFVKDGGTVTAGNASGINDGAAAVVLMKLGDAKKRNLTPLAKIVGYAQEGVDPRIMGIGPIPAIQKLLKKVNWSIEDVDLFELNEAFASQSLAVIRELGINEDKVNINGGAISLGHPVGASGARILVTLLYSLQRTGKRKGIAALCIGGGMGIAMAVEAVVP